MTCPFTQDPALDQVFLKDEGILRTIVAISSPGDGETVLEVGAGTGNLTRLLSESYASVVAVEADGRLIPALKSKFSGSNVRVIHGNALDVMADPGLSYDKVVSNPPYSISEPLVKMLFSRVPKPAVLTLPVTFAERLSALPGNRMHSKLSLFTHAFFSVGVRLRVGREAWEPVPDTDGAVVALTPRKTFRKSDSLLRGLALREDKKLGNALRDIFCERGMTRRDAREEVSRLGLRPGLLEKKISSMSLPEIGRVLEAAP